MKPRTFILLIIACAALSACDISENTPKMDDSLAGSISYGYMSVDSKLYLNQTELERPDRMSTGFMKLTQSTVVMVLSITYNSGDINYYSLNIENMELFGKPYDIDFNYYSESNNDIFRINQEELRPKSVKVEGSLYNPRAERVYSPPTTTRDWSPPGYEGEIKITVVLENGNEYKFEITRMS